MQPTGHSRHRETSIDGRRVCWSESGAGGKPLILVHGWSCDRTVWREQMQDLSHNYHTIALDLPGHGRSEAPVAGVFSLDLFVEALEAVRSATEADRLVLVGHSLGTAIALRYLKRYRERVAALVFVEGIVSRHRSPRLPLELLMGESRRDTFEKIIRAALFSVSTTPEIAAHILDMMLGAPEATFHGVAKAMTDSAEWDEHATQLPILGLYRDRSRLMDWKMARTRFPALEYSEIPETGHFLMLEKPQPFNRMLSEFLDKQAF